MSNHADQRPAEPADPDEGDSAGESDRLAPPDPGHGENPGEALYRNNLASIDWAIGFVCRRHGLSRDDAEDFRSHVHVKLLEDGYAVLRKFKGLSKLETFLVSTISHRCQDYRNAAWGRWRPSVKAVRLGDHATLIEQLIQRDGHTADETFELLRTNHGMDITRPRFETILAQLPSRDRRRFESEDALETLVSGDSADKEVVAEEERLAKERLLQAMHRELSALPAQDRLIIRLFDEDGVPMREIAGILGAEAPALFRRRDRIRATIRKRLQERGFTFDEDPE